MNKHRESKNTPPHEDSSRGSKLSIILSLILYAIPLIFFIICYFLIITSGEDIYQGANTTPDIIGDSIAAFNYNARLSDMYAWSVINFFDYKYSFGIDTIFRLLDVAMGMGIIYLMTYFALGHKPRLKISDATWFLFCFVMIFLTPHGRTLYAGFSVVHNYLIITLSTLVFLLPFIRLARNQTTQNKAWFALYMLVVGFAFGFSSNLTPIAFLITYAIAKTYSVIKHRSKINKWEVTGVIGTLVGISIQYLLGPGVASYINGDYSITYDYVSIGKMFSEPFASIVALAKHVIVNYGRVLLPLLLVFTVCFADYIIARKSKQTETCNTPVQQARRCGSTCRNLIYDNSHSNCIANRISIEDSHSRIRSWSRMFDHSTKEYAQPIEQTYQNHLHLCCFACLDSYCYRKIRLSNIILPENSASVGLYQELPPIHVVHP